MFILPLFLLLSHRYHVSASIEENGFVEQGVASYDNGNATQVSANNTRRRNYQHASQSKYDEGQAKENVFMNWTKDGLAKLLDSHGYEVKRGSEGWPLGMIGDVAYYPEELLPELGMISERRNLMGRRRLWLEGNKASVVPYYYDASSSADQNVFEAAVKTWSDNTCIKFAKYQRDYCNKNLGFGAVCVGDFGGCWSKLGKTYSISRRSQEMSVQPQGCEKNAAAHEFGHALGLCHEMARADRDNHIHVLYHNIDINVKELKDKNIRNSWFQGAHCSAEQMYDVPKPYDPMSLMQYGTSDFAAEDQRPVYLHKNPHYQYMFDYHRKAGYIQSHYDNLVMNVGYQCVSNWKKNCQSSGVSVPKCQNYGYTGKDCKCICPKGFSGRTCETKTGPIFPVMDRAKAMLDINEPGLVDMKGKGMHDENHNYPRSDFTAWQYIGVFIRSGDKTRISVDVAQNFQNVRRAFSFSVNKWFENGLYECQYGVHVYVGHSEAAKTRVECISSMVNNEPKEYATVLRSRTNVLDIMGVGGWAACYGGGPPITRMALEFQFTVSFLDRPEDTLSIEQKNSAKVGGGGGDETGTGNVNGTNDDGPLSAAMTAAKPTTMIGAVVGVIALLAVAGAGFGAYLWYRKRTQTSEETKPRKGFFRGFTGSPEEEEDSESSG